MTTKTMQTYGDMMADAMRSMSGLLHEPAQATEAAERHRDAIPLTRPDLDAFDALLTTAARLMAGRSPLTDDERELMDAIRAADPIVGKLAAAFDGTAAMAGYILPARALAERGAA